MEDSTKKMDDPAEIHPQGLTVNGNYPWYYALPGELKSVEAGKLTIETDVIKKRNDEIDRQIKKGRAAFADPEERNAFIQKMKARKKNKKKLYKAKDENGHPYFVKPSRQEIVLPYVLSEVGFLKDKKTGDTYTDEKTGDTYTGDTYYVYEQYDGDLSDLFEPDKKLHKAYQNMDAAQKVRMVGSIVLRQLLTARHLIAKNKRNFDFNLGNVLYRITDEGIDWRLIDVLESAFDGVAADSCFTDVTRMGTPEWMSPALYFCLTHRNLTDDDGQQALHMAKLTDIFSVGMILYWITSEGDHFWSQGLDDAELQKYRFQDLYYGGKYGLFVEEDKLTLFDDLQERHEMAELIKDMLSLPAKEQTERPVKRCDELIGRFCAVLQKRGQLPEDMILPRRYLLPDGDNGLTVMLEVANSIREIGGATSEWTEYMAYSMRDGAVCHVPLTFFNPHTRQYLTFRRTRPYRLFLYADRGKIFCRIDTENEKTWQLFSPDESVSFFDEQKDTSDITHTIRITRLF